MRGSLEWKCAISSRFWTHPESKLCLSFACDVVASRLLIEDQQWDVIALPGGMPGAEHLRDSEVLVKLLKAAVGGLEGASRWFGACDPLPKSLLL